LFLKKLKKQIRRKLNLSNKKKKEKRVIKYKSREMLTTHFSDLSEEKRVELQGQYYKKPDLSLVLKELKGIHNGSNKQSNITKYFFKDLMAKVHLNGNPWTIEEVFESKDVLGILYSFISVNDKVFPPEIPEIKKIETALRIGPSVAQKPSNYPMESVRFICNKYNINDNYYDYSCGWGARLLGALGSNVNYFGTDPNHLLTPRLIELGNLYKKLNNSNRIIDIRTQGSEYFIPEWENTMGFAFTSPPYFGYEDYKVGEQQSYTKDTSYEDWLNIYWKGTVQNIHKYLIKGGAFLVNIQGYNKFDLQGDCKKICEENGFIQVDSHILKTISRPTICANKELSSNEDIMVFSKVGETLEIYNRGLNEDEW
jgi:hypothetical protein